MPNDKLKPIDNLTYARNLIKFLPQALNHYTADMPTIRQSLQQLRARTCTGHAHWRDKDKPGKTAKLYILHGTDQTCPVHGRPPRGERTRHYVGNKPDKISEALAAIEREAERTELRRKLDTLEGTISYLTYQLQSLYRYLKHAPPDPREQRPGMPYDNGQVATE